MAGNIPFRSLRGFRGFLEVDKGLKQNNGKLFVDNGDGLATDNNGKLTVDNGTGLVFDNNGKLENEWYNMQPPSDLNMNSKKITNLGQAANPQDATRKDYVESLAGVPPLRKDLRAYYTFDGDYKDSTGNYDGTNNGTSFVSGKIGQGIDVDGQVYVDVAPALNWGTSDFTIALWVYPKDDTAVNRRFVEAGPPGSTSQFQYSGNNSQAFRLFTEDGGGNASIETNPDYPPNNWYFVAYTRSGSTGQIWINGQKIKEGTVRPGDISGTTSNVIGDNFDVKEDCIIDEVGVWFRVLSQGEIQHIYNNGNGNQYLSTYDWYAIRQSNHINMNDYRITNMGEALNGSDAVDKNYVDSRAPMHQLYQGARAYYDFEGDYKDSINGYDGTNNGTSLVSGKIGQAIDTSSGYVNVGSLFGVGSNDFAIAFWMYRKTSSSTGIAGDYDGTSYIYIANLNSGEVKMQIDDGGTDSVTTTNTQLNTNQWYFLTFIRDTSASEVRIYVDGQLDQTNSSSVGNINSAVDTGLGSINTGSGTFDGLLDEFGMWDRALTENEIKYLYHEGKGTNDFVSYDYTFNYDLDMNDHTIINTEQVLMREVSISDDSVHKIPVTQNMGKIVAHRNTTDMIEALYDLSNGTNTAVATLGSGFTLNTGSASGSTGIDGSVNLFFNNGNSEVIIENRAGSTITMRYCIYA